MESVTIGDVHTLKLNIRKLAEPNLIQCPGCCSDSFCDAANLRQHLQELQNRLDNIKCYACGAHIIGGLRWYINHLKVCPSVNTPRKNHVTKIECSSFADEIEVKEQSPPKPVSSGVKIILVPGLASSSILAPQIIQVLTPITTTAKDGAKNKPRSLKEKTTPKKRPLEPKQPDEASCAKIRATTTCEKESNSESPLSFDEPIIDVICQLSDSDDPLEPTSPNINEPSVDTMKLQDLDTSTSLNPAKITKEIVYKCKKCEFKTTKVEEQKKHHCAPTSCPYCDRTFKNNLMAGPHIKKHKLDALESDYNVLLKKGSLTKESKYCQKCNKHISLTVLDLHHKIHGEGGGFYSCGICKQCFVTKYALYQHSKDGCCTSKTNSNASPGQEKSPPKMFRCGDCSLWFRSLPNLLQHNKVIHKDLFTCIVCGVPFRTRISLLKHIDTNHKKQKEKNVMSKQYNCHVCDSTASSMSRFVNHITKQHPEIETELSAKVVAKGVCTAYCTVCKCEVKDGELHTKLHSSGIKVFSCTDCPEKFILQERMIRHAYQVHKKTISRSYNCDECSNTYNCISYLMSHTVAKKHSSILLEGKTILKCKFCLKPHLKAKEMYMHEKAHEAKGDTPVADADPNAKYNFIERYYEPAQCNECNKAFKTKLAAEVHAVAKNHMIGFEYLQPMTCYFCAKRFVRKLDMKRHMGAHIQGNLSCEICGKKFPTACTLRKHAVVHARFICCYCKKPKATEQELLEHTRTTHKDVSGSLVKCSFCVKYFANKEYLREHCKSLNHIECQMNETVTMTNDITLCEVCNVCIPTDLREFHAVLHSRGVEKFFTCPACPKQFCTVTNLGLHALVEHDSIQKALTFSCTKCPATASSSRGLATHFKKHIDEALDFKPFACKYCSKTFRRSSDRGKHELIHEGIKSHACTLCPKTFRLTYLLTLHMRTHTNERPYQCTLCDSSFKANSALRNHRMSKHQSERPHSCKYCTKTFKTRGALSNHVGMHEMLFKCNDCGRSFASRNAATTHIKKIHLIKDRELYVCIICNATYGRSLFLAQHMKTHGQLGTKEDLVQQLMEISCDASVPSTRSAVKRTRNPRKKK